MGTKSTLSTPTRGGIVSEADVIGNAEAAFRAEFERIEPFVMELDRREGDFLFYRNGAGEEMRVHIADEYLVHDRNGRLVRGAQTRAERAYAEVISEGVRDGAEGKALEKEVKMINKGASRRSGLGLLREKDGRALRRRVVGRRFDGYTGNL